MSADPVIVWFDGDLRCSDHAALSAACASGAPVVPVFAWCPDDAGDWAPGAASRLWLHHALARLSRALEARGSRLLLATGENAPRLLTELARTLGARAVYWNRRYEAHAVATAQTLRESLQRIDVESHEFKGNLLVEPTMLATREGRPYRVFTPFWRRWLAQIDASPPLPAPTRIRAPSRWPHSLVLDDLALLPRAGWGDGIGNAWNLAGSTAQDFLHSFVDGEIEHYVRRRDTPAEDGVSRLSPFLHFGELSAREAWLAACDAARGAGLLSPGESAHAWLRQLAWREFAHHLLWHFPHTVQAPLRAEFAAFPWRDDAGYLRAWQRGRCGYPLVDAGMRELWQTGWMHNRVRMVAASFLVKHLRQPWQHGARWFWDTLVDADLANNTLGWQWVAGCGADAAPFFRIFNPVTQGTRFDARGRYVRRWVPELARLPDNWLQRPWAAPAAVLEEAGVRLGETYPRPLVDHDTARAEALAAYRYMREHA